MTHTEIIRDKHHGWAFYTQAPDGSYIWQTGFLTRWGARRAAQRHTKEGKQ